MENLFNEWEKRIAYKEQNVERTQLEEMYDWEDWALDNYSKPPFARDWHSKYENVKPEKSIAMEIY